MEHPDGFSFNFMDMDTEKKVPADVRAGIEKVVGDLNQREVALMSILSICSCIHNGDSNPLFAPSLLKSVVAVADIDEGTYEKVRGVLNMLVVAIGGKGKSDWDEEMKELLDG